MKDLDVQMQDMDAFVARACSQNAKHLAQQSESIVKLVTTAKASLSKTSNHLRNASDHVRDLGQSMEMDVEKLHDSLEPLADDVCQPLNDLRRDVATAELREYEPTGETPQKVQYRYPTDIPRTDAHEVLIAGMAADALTPSRSTATAAPVIFSDASCLSDETALSLYAPRLANHSSSVFDAARNPLGMSLREVNPNLTGSLMFDPTASTLSLQADSTLPMYRRSSRVPRKHAKPKPMVSMEGRENVPLAAFLQSTSRRKSPRLH